MPQTDSAKARFLRNYERETATTLRVIHAFPADKTDFRPHERSNNALHLGWTFVVEQSMLLRALRGEDITLYGDGSQTRAFCYVDDLIEGFVRLVGTGDDVTGPINLGNPHEIPVSELAERIIKLTTSRSRVVYRELPQDDPMQRCPDIALAQKTLGWEPRVALDDGLTRTIAYFDRMLLERGTARVEPAD